MYPSGWPFFSNFTDEEKSKPPGVIFKHNWFNWKYKPTLKKFKNWDGTINKKKLLNPRKKGCWWAVECGQGNDGVACLENMKPNWEHYFIKYVVIILFKFPYLFPI